MSSSNLTCFARASDECKKNRNPLYLRTTGIALFYIMSTAKSRSIHLKDKTFRIAHMGDITLQEV